MSAVSSEEMMFEPEQRPADAERDELHMSADVFNLYLQDLGRSSKLLTAEEEVELAKTIEAGLFAEKILSGEAESDADASVEELQWLAQEGQAAKQRFIESNLRLTVSIAKRYGRAATNAMKLEDMVQEGNLGLMHALEKFDYQKGYKFSTYSTWWIKQSVSRSISMQARAIRIPVHRMEEIGKLLRFRDRFQRDNGREPTKTEFVEEFSKYDEDKIQALLDDARDVISLDAPVGDDGDTSLVDMLGDSHVSKPIEDIIEQDTLHWINRLIDETIGGRQYERDRYILRARFGLIDDKIWTLRDLSRKTGLSVERVRQIERASLLKLRAALGPNRTTPSVEY